jgi:hypothetical protein
MTTDVPTETPARAAEEFICEVCQCGVTIERLSRGAAFAIVDVRGVPDDTTFGIGPHGDPLCPLGHGEMPVEPNDNDGDPGEVPPPTQAELFDRTLPFNYEGAYLEVERLTVMVDEFARIAEEDKKRAASSRKTWEAAALRLHTATLELRNRRLAKSRQPVPPDDPPIAEAPEE